MQINMPESWHAHLNGELNKPYFQKLAQFVDEERQQQTVFPPEAIEHPSDDHERLRTKRLCPR